VPDHRSLGGVFTALRTNSDTTEGCQASPQSAILIERVEPLGRWKTSVFSHVPESGCAHEVREHTAAFRLAFARCAATRTDRVWPIGAWWNRGDAARPSPVSREVHGEELRRGLSFAGGLGFCAGWHFSRMRLWPSLKTRSREQGPRLPSRGTRWHRQREGRAGRIRVANLALRTVRQL